MAEWLYKATEAKLDKIDTMLLADQDGFLCRSLYTAALDSAARVRDVELGDTVHFYYRVQGKPLHGLGSFEIIAKAEHPHPEWFGDPVEGTALHAVTDPTFIQKRDKNGGYAPDPVHHLYTGWLLKKLGSAPDCPAEFAAGRDTLMRR